MKQKRRESPTGDLARDAAGDRSFPITVSTLEQLISYLRRCNACDGAIVAARTSWRSYMRRSIAGVP
ncbi:MAG: hypothetical protein HYX72_14405 [Acidobacteria bacterium]|nr:hypothetical protein [Acidobacteriota bacterium]